MPPATKGFIFKQMQSRAHDIRGVRAKDETGRQAYYYVLVDQHKIDAFEKALATGNLALTDYGKIIASGYCEPSEKVKQMMLDDYEFVTDKNE